MNAVFLLFSGCSNDCWTVEERMLRSPHPVAMHDLHLVGLSLRRMSRILKVVIGEVNQKSPLPAAKVN